MNFHQGATMRDFYFEDDENDINDFDEMMNEAMGSMMSIDHIYLPGTRNAELLEYSIRICEKNIFWYFRSEDFKLNKIIDTFFILKDLFSDEKE